MDNSRLPAKELATLLAITRRQGRERKRWRDYVKEDLHQTGSTTQQAAECV